jgi:hypothetical protein
MASISGQQHGHVSTHEVEQTDAVFELHRKAQVTCLRNTTRLSDRLLGVEFPVRSLEADPIQFHAVSFNKSDYKPVFS